MVQPVKRLAVNHEVAGSIPAGGVIAAGAGRSVGFEPTKLGSTPGAVAKALSSSGKDAGPSNREPGFDSQ